MKLYDLEFLNKPQTSISPNAAKIRYALRFKKVPYDIEWVNLHDMLHILPNITKLDTKRPRVPVIVHGEKVVVDSWQIALYLEEQFPQPSLFHGGMGVHKFFQNYLDKHILPLVFKCVCLDMWHASGPCQERFRELKEGDIGGIRLETFAGDNTENKSAMKNALVPIHQSLTQFTFITGDQPGWADIGLASTFTLMLGLRPDIFQEFILNAFEDDIISSWWNRMEAVCF